eukprot:Gregarina_sp_Poly_1__46@NODE_100_length_14458_cov_232_622472_g87_i0_p9_GENE_NODE_100_length_14458_cov_232_622472_g87_i0NODE_100_length_14458_cov_232_622472_g87_i0_p9_ORF_typecomplete_len242_score13_10TMEM107/PF14995_6/0_00024TMEM107/PF14995_6/1_5e04DUF1129/PF06570_11/7_6e02DUF1129/PF06570_11/0_048_NODE_100_length_14458_cov_232_622472_g87_i07051430
MSDLIVTEIERSPAIEASSAKLVVGCNDVNDKPPVPDAKRTWCQRCLNILTTLSILAVFYLNLALGVAFAVQLLRKPYSDNIYESMPPSIVLTKCPEEYESRRSTVATFNYIWIAFALIQGSGIFAGLRIVRQHQTCLATFCAAVTALATLTMIAYQIYFFRRWMLSPCDGTPINSLEAMMNRGFFVSQILIVVVAWYVFTVWCKPFNPVWQRVSRNKLARKISSRWDSSARSSACSSAMK